MKISQVSTQTIFGSVRQSVASLQRDLIDAQQESITGSLSDPALTLGEQNERYQSLTLTVDRLETIIDTNRLARGRLEVSLQATSSINDVTQDLLSALTANAGQGREDGVATQAGRSAVSTITGLLNTSFNGEYIFGGINSGTEPISDFENMGGKAALEAAFLGYFGFAKTDPAAAGISASQMKDFLDTVVEPLIRGAGWNANISSASDEVIVARTSFTQTNVASVSANEPGFRNAFFAAIIASEYFDGSLGAEAESAAAQMGISLVAQTSSDLAALQGRAGFYASRIERVSEQLTLLTDDMNLQAGAMVAVDPYDAATRLNSLLTQLETSYTLTGRIQQLSLMRFI